MQTLEGGPSRTTMPFGKHKGERLDQIPADYLAWLVANVRLGSGFRREIAAVLAQAPPGSGR